MTKIVTFFCYCDDAGPDPTMKDNEVRSIIKPITLRGPARMLKLKLTFKKPPLPGGKYLDSDIITVQKT